MTCKTPPTTFTRTWHISAAGDDTTGDGSAAKPWATPKSLFASGPWGGPRLASVPGAAASASLQPGDEVLVNDGSYGPLNVTLYGKQIVNKKWLRIAAAPGAQPGAHPIFDYLYVQGINRIVVSGLTLQSLKTDHFALVTVNGTDAQTRTTTSDIRVEDCLIQSAQDGNFWPGITQACWLSHARPGVRRRAFPSSTTRSAMCQRERGSAARARRSPAIRSTGSERMASTS